MRFCGMCLLTTMSVDFIDLQSHLVDHNVHMYYFGPNQECR